MKKYLFIIIALIYFVGSVNAQFHYEVPEKKQGVKTTTSQKRVPATATQAKSQSSGFKFDPRNLTFGGGLGLQFGDYTHIDISPQVGYNFSKYFNAGAGFSYLYYKDDYYSGGEKLKDKRSYLGFNLYGRVYPIPYIVLSVQPEVSRMWSSIEDSRGEKYKQEKFIPSVVVGGGVRLGAMSMMIKYDLVQDDYSPYGNNIFYSVGFNF